MHDTHAKSHCNEAENGERFAKERQVLSEPKLLQIWTLMSATQQKKHKQRKHFTLEKPHLQSKHPPSHCTTFSRHYNKRPPTNVNTSRNSRPSFLIDDVRFWMLFSNMEHAPFTTPQTWHNRVGYNALKMKIRCQPKLCDSVAFLQLFSSSLTIKDLHSHT